MAGWNPKMLSVVITPINTAKQLSALIAAADSKFTLRLSSLWIQMDIASTGNVYVGNSAVTATNCGYNLVPGASVTIVPGVNGMILATDVYFYCTVNNAQMNIIAQPMSM